MFGIIQSCIKKVTDSVTKLTSEYVEFKLVDENGAPVSGVTVRVTLPDDAIEERTSGSDGGILITLPKPGPCKVDFDWTGRNMQEAVLLQ